MALLERIFPPGSRITDSEGAPVPLAKIYTYVTTTSTPQATFTTAAGGTPNANPVICGSDGLVPPIFVLKAKYRVTIKDSTGLVTIDQQDDIAGPLFYQSLDTGFVLSNASDQTKQLQYDLSGITTSTKRTIAIPDVSGTMITSTYGVMGAAPFAPSQGANLTAANSLLPGTDGDIFTVTGNTQINLIASTGRTRLFLKFSGTPTIKHGQSSSGVYKKIYLSGSVDLVAAANTILQLVLIDSEWHECGKKVA